ncbi:phage terminase large subunit-like protein [Nocardia transvalensis]|uniref:Phage terminase large subunit-like protein n=1 Tax=Nocardia transvalensis TaxID=37333 RepID=A0A7W9PFT9_9NOCA|nr:terminase TerL endonuclease subunit [Nocardia transvalensis]MBB5915290.1 phage terminase large subunit-like protein [Nocardia transvalensis]
MTTRSNSPSPHGIELPDAEELERLKLSPEVAWYLLSRGIPLPDCPPRWKTPEPRDVPGARFDADRVDKVLATFRALRHTKGRLAGRPLVPDPWQAGYILAPTFGWVRLDEDFGVYVRIIRTLYVDVPRKNGKSTLSGGIGIYLTCADGEQGAQVITAATRLEQAQFVFAPIKQLAEQSPALRKHVTPFKAKIVHNRTGSYFQPVANAGDAQHGADLHGGIVDELHLHKTNELVEAIETGTGSRTQPLIVFITTADASRKETVYDRKRTLVEQLARGVLRDETTYGVIWAADPEADPLSEQTQRSANPGFGISPTRMFLRQAAVKAQQSPADLASYLRLHLGIRTKQQTKYLDIDAWDRNASIVDELRLHGRTCYGGLDLASTSDLCALCYVFPDAERGGYDLLWRLWTPEDNIAALDRRTAGAASAWVKAGILTTTPGNVADYDYIEAAILRDSETFDVAEIAYDRWNSSQLVNNLTAEGAPMVTIGQGYASLSSPTKELQRLVLQGTEQAPIMRHGGNPAVRWMVDNFAVAMDPAGNVKPDKASAAEKIDAVAALIMALARAIDSGPDQRSAYEDDDLMVV